MSSGAAEPVSVQILDKEYLIACPPEEREDLQKAAALLAARLKEIREAGKVIGTERSLVMVALNMANELAKLQARDEHRG
ncbi:MAG: cell division protein ZapA, partial [Steroidobacteraceae bacterium]